MICVANTVIKEKFGLNRYIARKTLNSSVRNFFVNFLISLVKFSQPAKTGDVVFRRVRYWWFDSYDVLNDFVVNLTDTINYNYKISVLLIHMFILF